jgi:hypothetical protein
VKAADRVTRLKQVLVERGDVWLQNLFLLGQFIFEGRNSLHDLLLPSDMSAPYVDLTKQDVGEAANNRDECNDCDPGDAGHGFTMTPEHHAHYEGKFNRNRDQRCR